MYGRGGPAAGWAATLIITDLAAKIGATVVTAGKEQAAIQHVYAGDRISDLLNHAGRGTLLVSHLPAIQVIRLAELMDLPAVCVVGGGRATAGSPCQGASPEPEAVAAAQRHGTSLLVSPAELLETCGRIYECLCQERLA